MSIRCTSKDLTSIVLIIQHELGLQQLSIYAVGRDIKHCC